jgi:hypothetical protein
MADDKGGGGGKGWEPFEMVLVILLAAGLLTQFQNGSSSTKKATPVVKKTEVTTPKVAESCGLTVTSPHALEKVASFVTLSGTTNGCNWPATDAIALYAQVIDAYGKPVSAYTPVSGVSSNGTTTIFNTTINLTSKPTGKGFVILVPATTVSEQSITTRIPITFIP